MIQTNEEMALKALNDVNLHKKDYKVNVPYVKDPTY